MRIRRVIRVIAGAVLIGAIVLLGYSFYLNRQELTPNRAKRMFLKYNNELTAIAEYVSGGAGWASYLPVEWYAETSYTKADFLPKNIKKYMAVYFSRINKTGSIHMLSDKSTFFTGVESHGETGAVFYLRFVYDGKDGEGCDVYVFQRLVYIKSNNPELFLDQIWLSVLGSIYKIADGWYLVTTSNH